MKRERLCPDCGMPPMTRMQRRLNWPFAVILTLAGLMTYGQLMFFCKSCGRCRWPRRRSPDLQ